MSILWIPLLVCTLSPVPAPEGPELRARRIASLIEDLGDPEIGIRNHSQGELGKMLPEALPALRQGINHHDAEIAARCRALLAEYEAKRAEEERHYAGRVALCDPQRARVAIDIRSRDGAKTGDRLQVTRGDQKVGILVIFEVQLWGSWSKPSGDTSLEGIQKGDRVERLIPK
jgi:hypothetical protein